MICFLCSARTCSPLCRNHRKDKYTMKIYENPDIDIKMLTTLDIIRTSSVGTETTPQDETDVNWNV